VSKRTLVIDGPDPEHFFLAVEDGTLRVGDEPTHVEGVMRGLRVVRIRCEVEFEDDRDAVPLDGTDGADPQPRALGSGSVVHLGHADLALVESLAADGPGPAAGPSPAADPEPAAPPVRRLLRVIDGADQGKLFSLPDTGVITVGKSDKHADFVLHDLYVSRVHCAVEVVEGRVIVTHLEGPNGTLIDGRPISRPEVLPAGSVLRVSNTHMRLEVGTFNDAPPNPAGSSGVLRAPSKEANRVSEPSPPEAPVFGHYRLGPVVGRGHSGVVHQATDVRTNQPVALKVFHTQFPAAQAELERFARAVRSVQPVRHPNLVTPLGAGRTGSHCWLAREFVDGESAADVIARVAAGDKPSWGRAARMVAHLARAVDCLSGHRLIHGNITPRNVLIRKGDHAAVLADLGLADALEGSKLGESFREEKRLAELPYLAPEQAEEGAFVDASADLYAVGALAYALIAGRPPVAGRSPEEILDRVRQGRVVRPGAYYKKVPAAFDGLLMKLLALHQEDRYPTAAAVLADLEPIAHAHEIRI
jgi:pSer/pThr/pTyr-binding forkhead associated (FHA) protein